MNEMITDMSAHRDALIHQKLELQNQLAALANQMHGNGHLPDFKFKLLQGKRSKLVAALGNVETRISEIKQTIKAERTQAGDIPLVERQYVVKIIRELRDRYEAHAASDDNGTEARLMAAQVVRDITPIIRRLCQYDDILANGA